MALTEKSAAEKAAEQQKADDALAAKRRADDTRTPEERAADRAADEAYQLELQQLVAQRADALQRGDEDEVRDIDVRLRGNVSDRSKN